MTLKQIIRSLETRKRNLAKERDQLRDLEYELSDMREIAESAFNDLECCIEKLSEQL